MAIVRSNAFPGTVFNPHLARQTSSSPSRTMRGIVVAPRLRQYPNGQPLDTVPRLQFSQTQNAVPQVAGSGRRRSLQGFTAAPGLQRFPNGQPLSPNPGGPVLIHKASLVNASLKRVMRKRCGLGDNGDTVPYVDPTIPSQIPYDTTTQDQYDTLFTLPSSTPVTAEAAAAANLPNLDLGIGAGTFGQGLPMSSIAGGYQTPASTPTSFLTSLMNSLTGRTSAPGYGASGLVSNFGAGLNTPIVAGSSITNGGVLVMGGIFVFLFMAMTGKKR